MAGDPVLAVAAEREGVPQRVHRRRQVCELLQVQFAPSRREPSSVRRRRTVLRLSGSWVRLSGYQGGLSLMDQSDGAVVAEQEVGGHVADRRPARVGVAPDRQQELVLSRRQVGGRGLLLTPVQEQTQAGSQLQEPLVVRIRQFRRHLLHILALARRDFRRRPVPALGGWSADIRATIIDDIAVRYRAPRDQLEMVVMTALRETYSSQAAARRAVEALRTASVPDRDIHLLTGFRYHDVRSEPVGGFAGAVDPTAPVGTYAGPPQGGGTPPEASTACPITSARDPLPMPSATQP